MWMYLPEICTHTENTDPLLNQLISFENIEQDVKPASDCPSPHLQPLFPDDSTVEMTTEDDLTESYKSLKALHEAFLD